MDAGVGFSVERQFIVNLPIINEDFFNVETVIQVNDSRIGWSNSFRQLLALLYIGQVPKWDVSKLRPKGARLKTFGGRASGPAPLNDLFNFCVDIFKKAAGRRLNSTECHDIVCKIADSVIVGGVRRSALISLSNLSDNRMRNAKNGQWWIENPQRALSNNSVAYTEKPEIEIFIREWLTLIESKSGERGIFNRVSATKKASSTGRRKVEGYQLGTNPCFSGDTLVAVADGRNAVSIKELAEINQPFPLYSGEIIYYGNQHGKTDVFSHWKDQIKMGVAFKTGTKQTVKVFLSNGDTFICTPDHKIALPDGTYEEVQNLVGKEIKKFFTSKDKYRRINSYSNAYKNQHRMIWEFYNGELPNGYVIDHIISGTQDFITNLQILSKEEHDKKTGLERIGENNPIHKVVKEQRQSEKWKHNLSVASFLENNPNFNGITNEELIKNGQLLIAQGKKITFKNLKSLDERTPLSFSKNRFNGSLSYFKDICFGVCSYNKPENKEYLKTEIEYNTQIQEPLLITDIKSHKIEDVYDIKVEDNSNFNIITSGDNNYENCQGVLVHNCGEIYLRSNRTV